MSLLEGTVQLNESCLFLFFLFFLSPLVWILDQSHFLKKVTLSLLFSLGSQSACDKQNHCLPSIICLFYLYSNGMVKVRERSNYCTLIMIKV